MYVLIPCPVQGCPKRHGVKAVRRANPHNVSPLRVSAGAPDASSATGVVPPTTPVAATP